MVNMKCLMVKNVTHLVMIVLQLVTNVPVLLTIVVQNQMLVVETESVPLIVVAQWVI